MPKARSPWIGFFFFLSFLSCLVGFWWSEIALVTNEKLLALSSPPSSARILFRTILRASWLLFFLGGALVLRFPRRFLSWGLLASQWALLWAWSCWLDLRDLQKLNAIISEAPLFQHIHILSQEWGQTQLHAHHEWLGLGWLAMWLAVLALFALKQETSFSVRPMLWASLAVSFLFLLPILQSLRHVAGLFQSTAHTIFFVACLGCGALLSLSMALRPRKQPLSQDPPTFAGLFTVALIFSVTASFRMFERLSQSLWLAEISTNLADFSTTHRQAFHQMLTALDRLFAWEQGAKAGLIFLFILFLASQRRALWDTTQQTPRTLLLLFGIVGSLFLLDLRLQYTADTPHRQTASLHRKLKTLYETLSLPHTQAKTHDWTRPATLLLGKSLLALAKTNKPPSQLEISPTPKHPSLQYIAFPQETSVLSLCKIPQRIGLLRPSLRIPSQRDKTLLWLALRTVQPLPPKQALRLSSPRLQMLHIPNQAPFPSLFPLFLTKRLKPPQSPHEIQVDLTKTKDLTLQAIFEKLPQHAISLSLRCP
ncbi:MAG: hypothetical protein H6727_01975 [Myxococcales bacterium]|nr:hypothetical protein [Myxococcales bacterium]